MVTVKQKIAIPVALSTSFKIIADLAGVSTTQKGVAEALGITQGDLANRKNRGTLAELIIKWGEENGVSAEKLFPELAGVIVESGPKGSRTQPKVFWPELFGGGTQQKVAVPLDVPADLFAAGDTRQALKNLKLFQVEHARALMPYWGILSGDLVLVNTAVDRFTDEGVYLLRLDSAVQPELRAIIRRGGGSLWIEQSTVSREHRPLPESAEVLGRVVWRAGRL